MDRSIDPTADQIRDLRDNGPDGPLVMVNLLKFRAHAQYPGEQPEPSRTGADAYALYEHAFSVTLKDVSGAQVLYRGAVDRTFIGDIGRQETQWDRALIVRYPSRRHFLGMLAHPQYREALAHRYAGLERTLTLQCTGEP